MRSNILYAETQTGTILYNEMVMHMFSNKFTQLSNVIAVVDFNKMIRKKEESTNLKKYYQLFIFRSIFVVSAARSVCIFSFSLAAEKCVCDRERQLRDD